MAYRASIYQQFHWSALQAIEKYLKCILLLNRIKATKIRHDLEKAMELVEQLPFELSLRDSTRSLINHLDQFGQYRYLEGSYFIEGCKLAELDRAVWELRRYCRVLNYRLRLASGEEKKMLAVELRTIAASEEGKVRPFRISGGFLEKIVDDSKHPGREALIWQNLYFGTRPRRKVRIPYVFHAVNAPLTLHPEILDAVLEYVFLPKRVISAFREYESQQ